ncbi:chromosome segregation protein SMC [Beijerinckia indica]|uniref:Chromosome partition protein Smc n=1 Tax=Beijerinckia indica subsp. indica (strain ATCC 9039 / DSM 1715 / NCIMB 8712) TaxID=395963 RepID=B2IGE6_BEII9|nr:chromosome segregation protein SMC [Beijerinckia indica]ACB94395.1 chromosome segregation protein SMC [Beijerinckia indica subsp. indica ATCC 9039]
MKFTKLHISGFKTFVDATDFLIEPGLTGIVGPNGCGKSNLVEAMRWVMGENSFKAMRASGMDDVIFSGSGERPARDQAEVSLVLDNSDGSAPVAFQDCPAIEVTRCIERASGSVYRINGREVRAKDVQLLFADASTGAKSPALVRQGQIGELISAKPQARRRILEEAAGIAGLHSRRQEAETRLKAAEENLSRLDDVVRQIDSQAEGLKRQAKQAIRYRALAGEIERDEALLAFISYQQATQALSQAETGFETSRFALADQVGIQGETARQQGIAAHALPPLRETETAAAGALQQAIGRRNALEAEEKRSKLRRAELERRIAEMEGDLTRETALIEDAAAVLAKLEEEARQLAMLGDGAAEERETRNRLIEAEAILAQSEAALTEVQDLRAGMEARRTTLEAAVREEGRRLARLSAEIDKVTREWEELGGEAALGEETAALRRELEEAEAAFHAAETRQSQAEKAHGSAREADIQLRAPLAEAERKAQVLATEVATLTKLLASGTGGFWPAVTESISVTKGYEAALGAALGDDLEASTNPSAPAHWALSEAKGDPSLPPGVKPLSAYVEAPPALQRSLDQIGVVLRSEGAALRALLVPGQRLVSQEGDLWRWDGFVQAAEAPTPAARRLVEKNRLADLTKTAEAARQTADILREDVEAAQEALALAAEAEREARQQFKTMLAARDAVRQRQAAAETREAQTYARIQGLQDTKIRLAADQAETNARLERAEQDFAGLDIAADLHGRVETARLEAATRRAAMIETRTALNALLRERQTRGERQRALHDEQQSWQARAGGAAGQIAAFKTRLGEARAELAVLIEAPDTFQQRRKQIQDEIAVSEHVAKQATKDRVAAEKTLAEAEKAAHAALEALGAARAEQARAETRLEAARARCETVLHMIAQDLDCPVEALPVRAGLEPGVEPPAPSVVEKRLETAKREREKLGAVNLRADLELNAIEQSRQSLDEERSDLSGAIQQLHEAIANLNKEGRERLKAAFDRVQTHFKDLFTTLFDGGWAELQLIEAADPLEAGLEILARPPGKKPQVMTLLSGGEQALTALSLIFAIFLTNPAPICVLDEVDAPLDDANVERFCNLLDHMSRKTETRFITITHNPITMARMNRLFGVTMVERGVSQLVSVNLEEAERFLETA